MSNSSTQYIFANRCGLYKGAAGRRRRRAVSKLKKSIPTIYSLPLLLLFQERMLRYSFFTGDRDRNSEIYVMNAQDGSKIRQDCD
jgi:hypothetical protein